MDSLGRLYSWGTPYAAGVGTTRPVLRPTLVGLDHLDTLLYEESSSDNNHITQQVVDFACGAGFTIAILASGQVCSWGQYANGR